MTPLEGLVMGTRAGDLDPGIVLELLQSGAVDENELESLLNRQSGMAALTGTNDMREIERRAAGGDEDCRRALALYAHRVRKYIGAYAAVMGGMDAIAFTGGVGENSAAIRQACLERLEFLGASIDDQLNREARLDAAASVCEISRQGRACVCWSCEPTRSWRWRWSGAVAIRLKSDPSATATSSS